jgi:hypothetical protein
MTNQNFTIDTTNMSQKQLINVGRLLVKAGQLDWNIDGAMTQIGYNTIHGNTFIWCEDEQYSLFINDYDSTIKALYTCFYDGEETTRSAQNTAESSRKWAERLYNKSVKKEESN